tara:strand:+ start:426 stop:776 length:351 start_codon:yes stop_codon:yes gene_type:complete
MAEIAKTSMQGEGSRVVLVTTLGASDTLVYTAGANATLTLNNASGGALTPLIDGDGATSLSVAGLGAPIDTSPGFTVPSIGIGETVAIPLDTISEYLKGVVTVTGGDAIEATLTEY